MTWISVHSLDHYNFQNPDPAGKPLQGWLGCKDWIQLPLHSVGSIPLISVTRALAGGFDPFYSLVTVKESLFLVSVFSGKIREFEGRCGSLAQERGHGHFTDHKYHSGLKKIRESWELNISTGVKIKQSLPQTKQFQYITREKWQS